MNPLLGNNAQLKQRLCLDLTLYLAYLIHLTVDYLEFRIKKQLTLQVWLVRFWLKQYFHNGFSSSLEKNCDEDLIEPKCQIQMNFI